MRANVIDQTKSVGPRGSSTSRKYKNSWKRDSLFVSTVAWFDLILGVCILTVFPSIEVLGIGVISICFSTTGIFGAYARNLKAIRIFHFWKIIFAFGISALVISIACDAKHVCLEYLEEYKITNCQAKLGFLAIFSLIVDTFFAAYCVFVIKRFAQKIPHLHLTEGCHTSCIDTSYLKARRLKSNSYTNLQQIRRKTDISATSSCKNFDNIRYRKKRQKPSDFSDISSCSSASPVKHVKQLWVALKSTKVSCCQRFEMNYGTFRSDSVWIVLRASSGFFFVWPLNFEIFSPRFSTFSSYFFFKWKHFLLFSLFLRHKSKTCWILRLLQIELEYFSFYYLVHCL